MPPRTTSSAAAETIVQMRLMRESLRKCGHQLREFLWKDNDGQHDERRHA
jgi:hypothetical protein